MLSEGREKASWPSESGICRKAGWNGRPGDKESGYVSRDGMAVDSASNSNKALPGRRISTALVGLALTLSMLLLCGSASAAQRMLSSDFGTIANPDALAVDPATHDVYVLNRGNGTIERFDSEGNPAPFSASQTYITGNQLSGTSDGAFALAGNAENQIAVAPPGSAGGTAGNLYVTEPYAGIAIFDSTGTYLGRITEAGGSGITEACGVATDPSGNVYVGTYGTAIEKYAPTANPPTNASFDSKLTGVGGICNIAADATKVYAMTWSSGPLTSYPLSLFPGAGGEADASAGGVVVEDGGSAAPALAVYSDPLSGELFVDEGEKIAAFGSSGALLEHFGSGDLTGSRRGVAADSSAGAAGQAYVSDPQDETVDLFVTPVPGEAIVADTQVSNVTATEARLEAEVDPHGAQTSVQFEYVTDTAFQSGGFAAATKVPATATNIGEGFGAVSTKRTITGLQPGTKYRFRVVAINSFGTTDGPDEEFRTYELPLAETCPNAEFRTGLSAALPNCRAYELVTPPIKDYDVGFGGRGDQPYLVASVDGNSAAFKTGGPLPGSTSGAIISQYLASRTVGGWQSQGISAPQAPQAGTARFNPKTLAFSPDLSRSVIVTGLPQLTPEAVPDASSLYLQDNHAMSWRLMTPKGIFGEFSEFRGASSDYETLYFHESKSQLDGVPTGGQVYGFEATGRVFVASVLPDGTIPQFVQDGEGVSASTASSSLRNLASADGSRVVFRYAAKLIANLYLRINAKNAQSPLGTDGACTDPVLACTIEISKSEKTNGSGPGGIQPPPPAGDRVEFVAANQMLTRVLFTSTRELTNDAFTGEDGFGQDSYAGRDLYEYDVPSGQLKDLTADPNPADIGTGAGVLGVLGYSDDASYVYFAATGMLTPGAESGKPNIYLVHDGSISFVATVAPGDGDLWNTTSEFPFDHRVTPDGQTLVFSTVERLTHYDNRDAVTGEPQRQVYAFRAGSGDLRCVSCNQSGARPIGSASMNYRGQLFNPSRYVSDDGRRVFFESADALAPRDTNKKTDVYMFEAGRVYLISSGTGSEAAHFADASPSGDDVFIATDVPLVSQDQDVLYDYYDVRVGGGFPPQAEGASTCSENGCRPPLTGAPGEATIGSSHFSGPGNLKRHKKHHLRHKRHHRRHSKHHQHRQKHAATRGRAKNA